MPRQKQKPGERKSALIRRLKDAARDPSFSPSSLGGGQAILDRAQTIKSFLGNQQERSGAGNSKSQWMLTAQQLQDECDAAEKELRSHLQHMVHPNTGTNQEVVHFASEALQQLVNTISACTALRAQFRIHMKGVQQAGLVVRQLGLTKVMTDEQNELWQEIDGCRQDVTASLNELTSLQEQAQQEVQECWPSALAGHGGRAAPSSSHNHDGNSLDEPSRTFMTELPRGQSLQKRSSLPTIASRPTSSTSNDQQDNISGNPPDPGGLPSSVSSKHVSSGSTSKPGSRERQVEPVGALTATGGRGVLPRLSNTNIPSIGMPSTSNVPAYSGPDHEASTAYERDRAMLEDVIARYPLADDTSKARIRMVFAMLRQRHVERLSAWQEETDALTLGAGYSTGISDTNTGGWSKEEHSMFVSLRMKLCQGKLGAGINSTSHFSPVKSMPGSKGGGGRGAAGSITPVSTTNRAALMQQLAVLMPGKTVDELVAHDDWLTAHKLMQRRRRDLLDAWSRERGQFLEDSEALLHESAQVMVDKATLAADRLAHELGAEKLRNQLEDQQQACLQKAADKAAELVCQLAAAAQVEAAAEIEASERAALNRQLINEYRSELHARQEADTASALQKRSEEEKQHAAEVAVNHERVEWRKAEQLVKQDRQKAIKEQQRAEIAAQERRLAKLRALVAPDVPCDPMRVLLPTEASSAVDEKAAGAFKEMYGYTTDQVYKDSRMRLFEALHQAGLHDTAYGRQVVAAAAAATLPRADNMTSDQRWKA